MRIGVEYYPEHWDKSIWEQDADLMKKTGVKIVRLAEFAWSRLEPTEDNFDFKWLDEAIDIFSKRQIDIFLCTPTSTPPLWLYENYPDAIQVGKDGHKISIGIRGHRCYNSTSLLKYSERIIDKMTKHYADNPAVIGWQIDNELEANHCCCPYCISEFRDWMKNKYKTLDEINKAYGNSVWSGEYSSWEQINPPFGKYQTWLNPSYMLDFNRYASDNMIKYVDFQRKIIRKNCPDTLITTNTWMCENMPDFYNTFENLDFVSYDNYPVTKLPDDSEELFSHAFHLDLMRGIKRKNFWIMEQLSGMMGCWSPMSPTPRPNMIKGYSLQAIAHGADAVLHFRWRTAISGAEMFWHGLIDHSNVPDRRFFEFESLCETVSKLSCIDNTKIKNRVAILYSSDQEYAMKIQPQVNGMYYFGQLKSYHDAFTKFGVGVDIINWSENLDGYKIVVAPTIYVTDEQVTKNLFEFVENGGTLILTNRSGVKNKNNVCIMEQLPTVFKDLAGAYVTEYDAIGYETHKIKSDNGKEYEINQWCDFIKTTTAKPYAFYDDDFFKGTIAATKNSYGKGITYYIGTVGKKDFYYDLAREVLNENKIEFFDNLPNGFEITIRENDTEKFMFIFNNSDTSNKVQLNNAYTSIISNVSSNSFELKPFDMEIVQL